MQLKTTYTITFDEIEKETGLTWTDFNFSIENKDGVAVCFSLTDEVVEELEAEIAWTENKCKEFYRDRCKNELMLIHLFRQLTTEDHIIIFM